MEVICSCLGTHVAVRTACRCTAERARARVPHTLAIGRASALRRLGRRPFPSGLYLLDVFDERSFGALPGLKPHTDSAPRIPTVRCICAVLTHAVRILDAGERRRGRPGRGRIPRKLLLFAVRAARSPIQLAVAPRDRGSPCMGTGARWAGARPAPRRARALARRLLIFGWRPSSRRSPLRARAPCSAIPRSGAASALTDFMLAIFAELRRLRAPSFVLRRAAALPAARGRGCAEPRRRRRRARRSRSNRRRRACGGAVPHGAEPNSGGAAQRRRAPWRPAAWRVSSVCGPGRLRARLAPVSGPVVGVEALDLSHSPRPCVSWHRIACFCEPGAAWRSRRRGYALSTHMWTMSRWSGVRRLRLKNRPLGPLGPLLDLHLGVDG